MRFVSTALVALDFEIDGDRYQVPIGGSCEIPDHLAYVPAAHRLPLVPCSRTSTAEPAAAAPTPPAADPLLAAYTVEQLRELDDAKFRVPKNASRKTLHELCDLFGLKRPPADIPNKEVAARLAERLEAIRLELKETHAAPEG